MSNAQYLRKHLQGNDFMLVANDADGNMQYHTGRVDNGTINLMPMRGPWEANAVAENNQLPVRFESVSSPRQNNDVLAGHGQRIIEEDNAPTHLLLMKNRRLPVHYK